MRAATLGRQDGAPWCGRLRQLAIQCDERSHNISASATDDAARRIVWHSPTRDGSRRARRGSFVSRVVRKAYEQREA
jgi:hypothetical protein